MFQTLQLVEGVNLHTRQTEQFKTVNFSIKWKTSLCSKAAAERSVLSNVLQHSNEQYPTTSSFRMYLDELYGTVLYLDTTKRGSDHFVVLNVETVNDHFLSHGNVLDEVLKLINTVVFRPNVQNGTFINSVVEREKEMVIQRIQAVFDDKARYAQQRLLQLQKPNHPASISANGTKEEVAAITSESLMTAYQKMLADDEIDIYVVGDLDMEDIMKKIKKTLPFTARTTKVTSTSNDIESNPVDSYVKELQDMKQGKLHIGFKTPIKFGHEDFPKMQIFNGVFGGYPHSKLFMNVREKESMAYYVSSSYSAQYGLAFVISGIDANKEKKALQLIEEQLEEVRKGNVTEMEMSQTKAMLTNQLKEALDSARGQIEIFDQYKALPEEFSIDTWAKRWAAVTKDDVVAMSKQLEQETVYFLCGKEEAAL